MVNFKEFLRLFEGGFIPDEKAEEGKSKPKKPFHRGPSSVITHGISGGPGGYQGAGGGSNSIPVPVQPQK